MNISTFKKLCLKAGTKKADEIHDYFIKLEETFQEIINEESSELRLQLQQKEQFYIQDRQQILLDSYNKKCIVYLIFIKDNLYKFGFTDNIKLRMTYHFREIGKDIQLIHCIQSKNNALLESKLKEYLRSTEYRRTATFNENVINL